ncbi:hypothetical protein SO802_017275 [Lithocarpus litseifolius]|uniref:Uncharacterized protein n=1 Tax=Lithocarpus litseifolius TaxID=425828 RepID=A0AAW2CZJ9_9ROSI
MKILQAPMGLNFHRSKALNLYCCRSYVIVSLLRRLRLRHRQMMMMMQQQQQQQQQLGFEAIASKPSDSKAMITLLIRHLPEVIPHDSLIPPWCFFSPTLLFSKIEKLCVSGFQQGSIGLPGSTSV